MGHKYLDELDYYNPIEKWGGPDDKRSPIWEKERELYGFDSRETWDLDYVLYLWLYEHLRMYMARAGEVVDLTYHKFTYKGNEYTQAQLINMMLERLWYRFTEDYDEWNEEDAAYVKEIGEIWAVVLPAMWW